jgi:DNA/RNA endonuclease YhcR with UshA esterase domain
MKTLWTFMAVAVLSVFQAAAQDAKADAPKKIGAAEAEKHIGQNLVVTGKVAQVTIREKVVFLNLDQPYPNSPFTGVIFASATNQFGDISKLKGKNVELKGKIGEHQDKPQIILNSTNQLTVLEKPDAK